MLEASGSFQARYGMKMMTIPCSLYLKDILRLNMEAPFAHVIQQSVKDPPAMIVVFLSPSFSYTVKYEINISSSANPYEVSEIAEHGESEKYPQFISGV